MLTSLPTCASRRVIATSSLFGLGSLFGFVCDDDVCGCCEDCRLEDLPRLCCGRTYVVYPRQAIVSNNPSISKHNISQNNPTPNTTHNTTQNHSTNPTEA